MMIAKGKSMYGHITDDEQEISKKLSTSTFKIVFYAKKSLQENINLKKLFKFEKNINDIIEKITFTLKNKGKILICGNGGSAADAQHLAAEFLVRLKPKPERPPFPVVSLAMDTSTLTACGND